MIKINYSLLLYVLKQYGKPLFILFIAPFALCVVALFFVVGCVMILLKTTFQVLYFPFKIMLKIIDANQAIKTKAKKSIKTQ